VIFYLRNNGNVVSKLVVLCIQLTEIVLSLSVSVIVTEYVTEGKVLLTPRDQLLNAGMYRGDFYLLIDVSSMNRQHKIVMMPFCGCNDGQ